MSNKLLKLASTGIEIPPSDLLMKGSNSFDESIVGKVNDPVQNHIRHEGFCCQHQHFILHQVMM